MKSKNKIFKNVEWGILICVILLIGIGLVAQYTASTSNNHDYFYKQLMWVGISIPIMIVAFLVDYEKVAKISPIFYGIFLVLLVLVLFTSSINGSHSWFNIGSYSFQPSEFEKIFTIITFSLVVYKIQQKGRDEISKFPKLMLSLLIYIVPTLLVLKEPDFGTAMAYVVSVIVILFGAGIKKRYIISTILVIAISVPLLYKFVLPDYMKKRIDVFLNPSLDPRGSGYNIIQSKLAIGSGEILGMGYGKGNQTQLGYLYPKTTDFIFSVIGEEMGFVATASIVVVYIFMITKMIYVAKTAKDDIGTYIALGIAGIFIYHVTENIGMTIGLLPITGVPLPFVSYGGSSMFTSMIMVGLILNISGRRKKAIFVE